MENEVIIVSAGELEETDNYIEKLRLDIEEAKQRRAAARKEGDLRENAEFELANEQIDRLSKELQEILAKRNRMRENKTQVFGGDASSSDIQITANTEIDIQIGDHKFDGVRVTNSDIIPGKKISADSKLGKELLRGHYQGEVFEYIDNELRRQTIRILGVRRC